MLYQTFIRVGTSRIILQLLRDLKRQCEAECTSLADPAFCPDSAPVTLHNSFGDVEAEPNASSIIRGHLKKPQEHGFHLVACNADAGVAYREPNLIADPRPST